MTVVTLYKLLLFTVISSAWAKTRLNILTEDQICEPDKGETIMNDCLEEADKEYPTNTDASSSNLRLSEDSVAFTRCVQLARIGVQEKVFYCKESRKAEVLITCRYVEEDRPKVPKQSWFPKKLDYVMKCSRAKSKLLPNPYVYNTRPDATAE